jgi:hypothetical protein
MARKVRRGLAGGSRLGSAGGSAAAGGALGAALCGGGRPQNENARQVAPAGAVGL